MINPLGSISSLEKKFHENTRQERRECPSLGMCVSVVVLGALKAADTENYKNR